MHLAVNKFSQLSNNEKNENLSTIDEVGVCNSVSYFLDHPVRVLDAGTVCCARVRVMSFW